MSDEEKEELFHLLRCLTAAVERIADHLEGEDEKDSEESLD